MYWLILDVIDLVGLRFKACGLCAVGSCAMLICFSCGFYGINLRLGTEYSVLKFRKISILFLTIKIFKLVFLAYEVPLWLNLCVWLIFELKLIKYV